jgi:respiratory burst oxidase
MPMKTGMTGSDEFTGQVFDALARRRGISAQVLTKDQVREFWQQLMDHGFDARLQTFFDMYEFYFNSLITD